MKNWLLTASIVSMFIIKSPGQSNGDIIGRRPVTFPSYATVKDISWYYEQSTYENAINDKSVSYERITYSSDGLKVVAFIAAPVQKGNKNLPVIIFNRGSFVRNDIAFVHAPLFQKFVQAGFMVVAPALRQSEGGEGKDQLGGEDINDILNLWPLMHKLAGIDLNNVFMLGESRGGMMTFLSLKNKVNVRAAATIGAITELSAYISERPWDESNLKNLWDNYDHKKNEILDHRSVMAWYDSIRTPLLILHGGKDPQVKPQHSLQLGEAFSAKGHPYELHIFSDGNHILSGAETDTRDAMVIGWFRKYIQK